MPSLQRLCIDQLGDAIDIACDVIDVLPLVDSPSDPIYRFIGIDIRHIRSAPLKVFQQLKADRFILLSRLVSISVEHGEESVERGLSKNPFVFCQDFGETHVLGTSNNDFRVNSISLCTRS